MSDDELRSSLVRSAGNKRAAAIERAYWQMISKGQLHSAGWKLAVRSLWTEGGRQYTVECVPVAPGECPPWPCEVASMSAPRKTPRKTPKGSG